jgi:protease IV
MRKFWIVFVVLVAVVGLGIGMLKGALESMTAQKEVAGGVLVWKAEGALPEETDTSFLERLRRGEQPSLAAVLFGLRRAARDPDVTALILDLRGLDVSYAQLAELREAVGVFRATGKPVWACVEAADAGDYALAVSAARVAMAPEGNLMVLGVAAELAFIKDTLAKVGIAADFISVGKYKSAPEQYTRSEPSEASREMTESIVNARYEDLVDMVSSSRHVAPGVARGWIDVGLFDAPTALAQGLVDTLATVDALVDGLFPDDEVSDFADYAAARPSAAHDAPVVALIQAAGVIMSGESGEEPLQGRVLGSDTLVERLRDAREDADVQAVILRVDSPGGSVEASDLIWQEIERVREAKPIIVSMGTYAASGGYYISCGADSIFADAGTLTGSIGVFAGKLDWSGLYAKVGVKREFVTRGENALMFSDATSFSPAQRALFQAQLDRFYERFLAKVGAGRDLERDAVHAIAQGRVWTGRQAVALGLVDGVGGLERAISAAKGLLGVAPDDPVNLRTYEEELSWLQRMILQSLDESALALPRQVEIPAAAAAVSRQLARSGFLAALPLLDGRPLALVPCRLFFE